MDSEVITKDKMDFTIDLLITMTVDEIAETLGKETQYVLKDFLESKTGKLLYDESSKLWWNGPSYIADMYLEEKKSVSDKDLY